MVGLKASTEERQLGKKEQNVSFYYKNTRMSHRLYGHMTHGL